MDSAFKGRQEKLQRQYTSLLFPCVLHSRLGFLLPWEQQDSAPHQIHSNCDKIMGKEKQFQSFCFCMTSNMAQTPQRSPHWEKPYFTGISRILQIYINKPERRKHVEELTMRGAIGLFLLLLNRMSATTICSLHCSLCSSSCHGGKWCLRQNNYTTTSLKVKWHHK